jgi:hypothetical protein
MKTAHKLLIGISIFMVAMVAHIEGKAQNFKVPINISSVYDNPSGTSNLGITFSLDNPSSAIGGQSSDAVFVVTHNGVSDTAIGWSNKDTLNLLDANKPVYIHVYNNSLGVEGFDTIHLCLTQLSFSCPSIDTVGKTVATINTSTDYVWPNPMIASEYGWNFGENTSYSMTYTHKYGSVGTYNITLKGTSTRSGGTIFTECFLTKQIIIVDSARTVVDTTTSISPSPIETRTNIIFADRQLIVQSEVNIRQVQVFNLTGQLIKVFTGDSNRSNFSLQELSNGIYIVSVMDANEAVSNKRIIVM